MKKLFLSSALLLSIHLNAAWDNTDMRELMQKINTTRTEEAFNAALADLYKQHGNPELSNKGLTFLNNALNQWKSHGFNTASFLTYLAFTEQHAVPCPTCAVCVECPPAVVCPECAVCPEATPTAQPESVQPTTPVISPTEPAPQTEIAPVETPTQAEAPQAEPVPSSAPLDAPAESVPAESIQTPAPAEVPAQPVTPEAMVADLVAQVEQTANLIQAAAQDSSVAEKISEEQLKYLRLALAKAMRALKKSKETV